LLCFFNRFVAKLSPAAFSLSLEFDKVAWRDFAAISASFRHIS
jgi:hypothetical protein